MAIPVVSRRTVPRSFGGFTMFPATIITAIVSPIARPRARITPDAMPFLAAGKHTLKMVSVLFAPSPNEASLNCFGTVFKAVKEVLTMVGRTIIVKTKITASIESPTMGWPLQVLKFAKIEFIAGTMVAIPTKPNTTDGTLDISSTSGFKNIKTFFEQNSDIKTAVKIPIGALITIAPMVEKTEALIMFRIPNLFALGFQLELVKILKKPSCWTAKLLNEINCSSKNAKQNKVKHASDMKMVFVRCSALIKASDIVVQMKQNKIKKKNGHIISIKMRLLLIFKLKNLFFNSLIAGIMLSGQIDAAVKQQAERLNFLSQIAIIPINIKTTVAKKKVFVRVKKLNSKIEPLKFSWNRFEVKTEKQLKQKWFWSFSMQSWIVGIKNKTRLVSPKLKVKKFNEFEVFRCKHFKVLNKVFIVFNENRLLKIFG